MEKVTVNCRNQAATTNPVIFTDPHSLKLSLKSIDLTDFREKQQELVEQQGEGNTFVKAPLFDFRVYLR